MIRFIPLHVDFTVKIQETRKFQGGNLGAATPYGVCPFMDIRSMCIRRMYIQYIRRIYIRRMYIHLHTAYVLPEQNAHFGTFRS
jgi:hypothetical protein